MTHDIHELREGLRSAAHEVDVETAGVRVSRSARRSGARVAGAAAAVVLATAVAIPAVVRSTPEPSFAASDIAAATGHAAVAESSVVPVTEQPAPSALEGIRWVRADVELTGIAPPAVGSAAQRAWLQIENGRVSGHTGTNAFNGPMAAVDGVLRSDELVMTYAGCGDDEACYAEGALLTALTSGRYFLHDGWLETVGAQGRLAFVPDR